VGYEVAAIKKSRPSYWQPGDVASRPPPFITDYLNSSTRALTGKTKRQSPCEYVTEAICERRPSQLTDRAGRETKAQLETRSQATRSRQ
jgi:hypothetical protein